MVCVTTHQVKKKQKTMQETIVIIVGAGPAGLATSACLNLMSIPNIILEREDCYASLWKKRAYDRLKLHLAKQFCQLPHMPFPPNAPTFIPKSQFVQYLDDYVSQFNISPLYHRFVESAKYNDTVGKWCVMAKNLLNEAFEEYVAEFVVVASGENSEGYIPNVLGLDSFTGEVMHSNQYENGKRFSNKEVLVVGSGNSGMEIAYDLSNWGVKTSIVIRSPVHVLTTEIVQLGMTLLKYIPLNVVDNLVTMLGKLRYGDLLRFGLRRPTEGPFYLKSTFGRPPVIDVGTVDKIKNGDIQVLPAISMIKEGSVEFENGETKQFDAIIFATGYKTTVKKWLKDGGSLFGEDGMPKREEEYLWKGENGLYCAGFARAGLFGIANDAKNISNHIHGILKCNRIS